MSDDVVRLSDLVQEYSRYYKVSPQEAAYALRELIDTLYMEYGERRGNRLSINNVFWVGLPGSSQKDPGNYNFHFQLLSQYFHGLYNTASEYSNGLVSCYSENDAKFKEIPANLIWLSRCKFVRWALDAEISPPESIRRGGATKGDKVDPAGGTLKTLELESVRKIMVGLVELIKELDKAHSDQSTGYDEKRRSDRIKARASRLSNPPRKNFDVYKELILFAEDAGIEMVKDRETLRRYMLGQSKDSQ